MVRSESGIASFIGAAQISALFSRARLVYSINAINAVIVVAFLWNTIPNSMLLMWMLAVIGITAVRFHLLIEYDRDKFKTEHLHYWKKVAFWGAAWSGIAWGMSWILLFPQNSLPQQIFLLVVILGMLAGSSVSWHAYFPSFLAYSVPTAILTFIRFILSTFPGNEDRTIYAAMGALFLPFIGGLYAFARNSNQLLTQFFVSQHEKSASDERYSALFQGTKIPMLLVDPVDGQIVDTNDAAENYYGYPLGQLKAMNIEQINALANQENIQSLFNSINDIVSRHRLANGEIRDVEVHSGMFNLEGCQLLYSIVQDITERNQAKISLLKQKQFSDDIINSLPGIFYMLNQQGVIVRVNPQFQDVSGYSNDELANMSALEFFDENDKRQVAQRIQDVFEQGDSWVEASFVTKSGQKIPYYLSGHRTNIDDQTYLVGFGIDISQTKAAEDEIKILAFFDSLTRLPNRRLLLDRLKQALVSSARTGNQGALLFIDLDNFKSLNDTLGHDIGDILLQQVARRLESCVREVDTVARLGGDEFVVLLEDLSEHSIEAASQTELIGIKVLNSLNQTYQLGIHVHHSTPSIGATLFNKQESMEELLKQADIAMYQAKKAGRNTLRFFDPEMQLMVDKRMLLEAEMRKAVENDQFHLYYQIQVDHTQRPLGAEALIRWMHPERGLISPAEFIPIAEEIGLINTIGGWVLKTACAQIKAWQNESHTKNLVLSINVSAKQFHKADFADQVKAVLECCDINPKLLKLELTEGMLLENIDDTIPTMFALRDIGVGFSLDDFGTGYSSLQYLKQLPLTQLKIDQSFVRDISFDNSDKAIVSTIVAMAHSLNLDVIAEGVETEGQREILCSLDCTNYQGYLFGKPLPIEQFEKTLTQVSNVTHPVDQTTKMLRLNWHRSYDCGESTIDHEHRKLFDLANKLIDSAFTRNENSKVFDSAMEKLLAHVVQHFADEEAILAQHHYADLADHASAHKELISHALKLRDEAAVGGVTIGELVNFIAGDVVAQHMLKVDRKFYPLFQESITTGS